MTVADPRAADGGERPAAGAPEALERLRHAAAAASAVLALVVLAGWALGVGALTRPGSVSPLTPPACVGFAVAALGTWRHRRVAGALTVTIALVAAGEAASLWNVNRQLGVDQHVSRLTATALLLLGAALLCGSRPLARWLAFACSAIGLSALIGFALGVGLFYGSSRVIQVSWPAAVCFTLLPLAIGLSYPESRAARLFTDRGLGGSFVRTAAPAVFGIPILAGTVFTATVRAGWLRWNEAAWGMTVSAVGGLALLAAVAAERLHAEGLRLNELAVRDPLTGAYNRRHFAAEATRAAARADRYGERAAVAVIDLDHFKEVNDRWGHAVGDEALVRVHRALRRRLRSSDVLGRIGGDEFAALISHVDVTAAERVAAEMRAAVCGVAQELAAEGRPTRLAASVGVAPVEPGTPLDAAELIDLADRRMYAEKRFRRRADPAQRR